MVPERWKLSLLEEISDVSSGGTPSRKNGTYWNGNIPWVTTAEVQFTVIEDTVEKITEEGLANSSAKLFPVGTILMAMYGQGKTRGQVAKLGVKASTNQACAAIVLHEGYEVDYYYQFLASQYENIRKMANSGGQQNLSGGIVKSIQVPVPPKTEQKKIAQILSTWDKAITTTEQLLANSQQQKKALMQQLLTGKKRLLDDKGVRYSGKWEVTALANLASITMGSSPKSAAYNEQNIGLPLLQGNADIKNRESAPRVYTSQITRKCEKGDILVSVRAPVGSIALSKHIACIGRGIAAVKAKKNTSQSYLYQWLLWFEPKWVSLSQGSTFESINSADLKSLLVQVPPIKEQVSIASVLNSADQEIISLHRKVCSLKTEKKALMQQLLTGKRRVKVDEAAA